MALWVTGDKGKKPGERAQVHFRSAKRLCGEAPILTRKSIIHAFLPAPNCQSEQDDPATLAEIICVTDGNICFLVLNFR